MNCAYCGQGKVYNGICDVCETPNLRNYDPMPRYDPFSNYGSGGEGMGICFVIAIVALILDAVL